MGAYLDDTARHASDAHDVRSLCHTENLRDRFEAEAVPLLQEAYLRADSGFARFEPGTNLTAWLYRLPRNTFSNTYWKREREPMTVADDWWHFDVARGQVEASGDRPNLYRAPTGATMTTTTSTSGRPPRDQSVRLSRLAPEGLIR
ncbi:hypothetical protein AB0I34_41655 [Kribbella sp. NPDC050281]|uniref:hypothetical protein n=1 Tax=Kribbella sp. NPDC050281 TaxID=3155515 RepID=UPI0033F077B4